MPRTPAALAYDRRSHDPARTSLGVSSMVILYGLVALCAGAFHVAFLWSTSPVLAIGLAPFTGSAVTLACGILFALRAAPLPGDSDAVSLAGSAMAQQG